MKSLRWFLMIAAACSLLACAQRETPRPQAAAPPPAPPPAPPQAAAPAEPEALHVYFARDSARLGPGAVAVIDHAARLYREGHPSIMLVVGHADRTGTELHNAVLSAERADAVKQAMVARGIPDGVLSMRADGWTDLPVSDPPGQSEPKDRVSVVTWR
jgi:outer membrane protein OmpA-like peptidoglycan-associated protein